MTSTTSTFPFFIYHKVSAFCAFRQEFIKVFIMDLNINNNYLQCYRTQHLT